FLVYPHSPSLCALVKPVSEKLDSPGIGCHCFLSVYFEEQLLFNERDDVFQRLHRTCLALAEDHHIVRISYELMPSSLPLMIQLVQHEIRTHRAKWTSLRYSHFGIHEPSAFHCACLEVFMNQRNHSPVLDISGQNLYQLALIDCVKELLQVHIHRPHIALFQILPTFPKCVLRASSRTEAVACFCEFRFVDRCQHLCYALLDDSVYCCW